MSAISSGAIARSETLRRNRYFVDAAGLGRGDRYRLVRVARPLRGIWRPADAAEGGRQHMGSVSNHLL